MRPIRPVIMCGGSGTRLWPLSRKARPKHLLPLFAGRSLLQETATRLKPGMAGLAILPPLVITGAAQSGEVIAQLEAAGVAPAAVLVEPEGRNTAAVAAEAVAWSRESGDSALMLLLPSDHYISAPGAFAGAVAAGARLAEGGRIVTFGIVPDRPHTGYGYIRSGEPLETGFALAAFKEKPDAETASRYLAEGGYSWNAGIFLFHPEVMDAELAAHAPDIAGGARQGVGKSDRRGRLWHLDPDAFAAIPARPLDIAVMERTSKAAVIPTDMGWSDVGSWSSLFEALEKDGDGNLARGNARLYDCHGVQAHSSGTFTAVVGMEGVTVVVTEDAVLVIGNASSEGMQEVVADLRAKDRRDLL